MSQKTPPDSLATPQATSAPRWWLPFWLLVYATLTLWLAVVVPLNLGPDEPAHVEYVEHLATRGTLPTFVPRGANFPGYEFHQPPFYYALCVPLWKLTPPGVQNYTCRVVTLCCGVASLLLLWLAVRALFPDDGELAMLAVAFGALWPLHQNVGAVAGNDAPADLICSAIFALIARGAGRAWQRNDALALGVLIGLGMLTKNTCLVIVPAALGAAWVYAACAESEAVQKRVASLKAVAQSSGVAALVCGWWLARNQRLYGDPLAAKIFDVAFRNSSLRPSAYFSPEAAAAFGQQVTLFIYLRALLLVLFCTTWGIFGGPNTAIKIINPFAVGGPAPQVVVGIPPMLICLAATLLAGWGLWRWRQNDWLKLPPLVRSSLVWWLVGTALVAFALVQFNLIQFQGQARYLHPAFLPLALFFCLGWRQAFRQLGGGRWLWPASAAFALTLLYVTLWNILVWRTLV